MILCSLNSNICDLRQPSEDRESALLHLCPLPSSEPQNQVYSLAEIALPPFSLLLLSFLPQEMCAKNSGNLVK